ncbi:MAG: EAL domain-containing protein [Woeseiaceae bacterium]|nr:EAL domain-containing protein [Woeseiaceae bacterium]
MSDPGKRRSETGNIEFTQTLRKLTLPSDTVNDELDEQGGTALLLCRDSASRKWGPRWLSQAGLEPSVPTDPSNALALARSDRPDVILVEAALVGGDGGALYQALLDAADLDALIIVLCTNSREVSAALDAGAFDVARKPFEWRAIASRASYALKLRNRQSMLDASIEALAEALELANVARERLRSRETFEPVTGLPNKAKFMDLLKRGMRASERDATTLAVFVIGFTRFRLVIEAMGQEQADLILTEIGRSLEESLRSSANEIDVGNTGLRTAAVASLDQFRFGVMMTSSGGDEALTAYLQDVLEMLARPIQVSGQTVHLSACIGIALFPQDAKDVDSLLQRADNAMRDAQSRGGGFRFYCTETDAAAARKLRIEHLLHEALDRDELSLVYQPINAVETDEVLGAEALLRWRQPDGSFIPPDEFVVVAEESGLMVRTGEYALNQACEQLARWRADGLILPRMCVNVAKVQLMSNGFARTVERALEANGLKPGDLELEISERGVLSGDYEIIKQLHELRRLGIGLSIDDFGTGDSAIAYLKELPVDALKIDRSYIAGLTQDGRDAAIASAMVALGQRLDLVVIAEGVETDEQLAALRQLGCDAYQGFLMSEPVTADAFAGLVRRRR